MPWTSLSLMDYQWSACFGVTDKPTGLPRSQACLDASPGVHLLMGWGAFHGAAEWDVSVIGHVAYF